MPWVEALSDPSELRRCIRDLLAISVLPGLWKDFHPSQIAQSVAGWLASRLDVEFVHICLRAGRDEPDIEVTRTGQGVAPGHADAFRRATREWLHRAPRPALIENPVGPGWLHLAALPIGVGRDAFLVGASRRAAFPTELHRLLLGMAANDMTVALQRWHSETDERRFAKLADNSSDFIAFATLTGVPQYINPAGLRLVGLDAMAEARRVRVTDFLMPEAQDRVRAESWPRALRDGHWTGELAFRHFKTGAAIPFRVEWFRIDDPRSGEPINIATVSRDLTAQKRAEADLRDLNDTLERRVVARTAELAEANRQIVFEMRERERADARLEESQLELFHAARLSAGGQMAVALAHELNQPLTAAANSINAARRLLAKTEAIASAREALDEAVEQTLRAGQIIRRLRDFVTRGETEKRVENVATMIEEASALALTGSAALGLQVRFNFGANVGNVFVNRIQIQQVLVNLMRNAVEAMTGGARRELTVTTAVSDAETVEVVVADSGTGLTQTIMAHLFEPFVSTKRNGMGLGLSICRSIVESHGGQIRGEPNPGGGALFRFTLAAAPADGDLHGA